MMIKNQQEVECILQFCLDLIWGGKESVDTILTRYPNLADELRPPLEAAGWLRDHRYGLKPRPEFVTASRCRLVARIQRESRKKLSRPAWQERLGLFFSAQKIAPFALILLLLFVLFASTTVIATSQSSLPGDGLYTIKLTLEQITLLASFDENYEAHFQIRLLDRRLEEVRNLIIAGRYQDVEKVLPHYEGQVHRSVDSIRALANRDQTQALIVVEKMNDVMSEQVPKLINLGKTTPPSALQLISEVIGVSEEGQAAALAVTGLVTPVTTPVLNDHLPAVTHTPQSSPTLVSTSTPSGSSSSPQQPIPTGDRQPTLTPTPAETEVSPSDPPGWSKRRRPHPTPRTHPNLPTHGLKR